MEPRSHPRLLDWWMDNPSDPDRPTLNNPDVERLVAAISPHSQATDLGGTMSLNAHLDPAGLVLRVHQPFVLRARLIAVQEVRRCLIKENLIVPVPKLWHGATMFRCGTRWAELEDYIAHERLTPTFDSYAWMFRAMGTLHHELAALTLPVPRPLVATYASPATLRRWLSITDVALQHDGEAQDVVRLLHDLVRRLRREWLSATSLPAQLVHGDVRLSNIGRTPNGKPVYLDFGFLATRPRIHDLAYAVAYMVRALDGHYQPQHFAWKNVPLLIKVYENAAGSPLTPAEKQALAPYIAAVPLYHAVIAGLSHDPLGVLRFSLPFLRLSEWLLTHREAGNFVL